MILCSEKLKLNNAKYGPRENSPVNLSVIERIEKGRERYYPDNEGIPAIIFYRDGKNVYQWMFDKGEEQLRDKCFNRIIKEAND
jgi:hypothetical protein